MIFRTGSLVVDHDVFVENSPSVLLDVVNVMKNISTGKTNVTYNGNDVNALSVSYTDSSNNKGNVCSLHKCLEWEMGYYNGIQIIPNFLNAHVC